MARKKSDKAAADGPSHTAQQLPERLAERHDYVTSSADMNFHVRFFCTVLCLQARTHRDSSHCCLGTPASVFDQFRLNFAPLGYSSVYPPSR